jgi:hypothetical protein
MNLCEVKGAKKMLSDLLKRSKLHRKAVAVGLGGGALFLQRESQKIVPVQLGNLKNSAGSRVEISAGGKISAIVFYTAAYAVFVHENPNAAHGRDFNAKYAKEISAAKGTKSGTARGGMFNRGPNQQYKFLERPAREKRKEIVLVVYALAKGVL